MYKCIIFDVDGTLVDSEKNMLLSLQRVLEEKVDKLYPLEDLRFTMALPSRKTFQVLGFEDKAKELTELWGAYAVEYGKTTQLFDGVKEMLEYLNKRGITIGIVTSRTKSELDAEFERLNIKEYMKYIVCADDTKNHKPHPDPILKFLEVSGVNPADSIYIGDTLNDFYCSMEAGVKFGLALWGNPLETHMDATHHLESPLDLKNLIG